MVNMKQLSSEGKVAYLVKPILKVLQEAGGQLERAEIKARIADLDDQIAEFAEIEKKSKKTGNTYKEFNFKRISYMYKVPIMPYIKLNLEKNFYMSELWAFKIGANLLYNFGMEFDMDKLGEGGAKYYAWDKYKFSSLVFEVFFGFGFGRPK